MEMGGYWHSRRESDARFWIQVARMHTALKLGENISTPTETIWAPCVAPTPTTESVCQSVYFLSDKGVVSSTFSKLGSDTLQPSPHRYVISLPHSPSCCVTCDNPSCRKRTKPSSGLAHNTAAIGRVGGAYSKRLREWAQDWRANCQTNGGFKFKQVDALRSLDIHTVANWCAEFTKKQGVSALDSKLRQLTSYGDTFPTRTLQQTK